MANSLANMLKFFFLIDCGILIIHSWWEVRLAAGTGAKPGGVVLKHAGSKAGRCFLDKPSKIGIPPHRGVMNKRLRGRKTKEEGKEMTCWMKVALQESKPGPS